MSLLQTIDPTRLGTPVPARPAPERLIAGDPEFLTWALDSSRGGEVKTGIWQATPGETVSIKGETFEFCHLLEGVIELTEEGRHFLPKARQIVAALEEAEECMRMVHQRPAGRLRVDASVPVMLHCVVPHVAEFRRAYPEISLELTSNDRIVDLMEHRTDVALRMGPLTDSTLHARALRPSPRWMMASPDYIARRGAQHVPERQRDPLAALMQRRPTASSPVCSGRAAHPIRA